MELIYDDTVSANNLNFHGYLDADWSGNTNTSQSTSGHVSFTANGAIGWSSHHQPLEALLTTESEPISALLAKI